MKEKRECQESKYLTIEDDDLVSITLFKINKVCCECSFHKCCLF